MKIYFFIIQIPFKDVGQNFGFSNHRVWVRLNFQNNTLLGRLRSNFPTFIFTHYLIQLFFLHIFSFTH